jgi:dihydroorotase
MRKVSMLSPVTALILGLVILGFVAVGLVILAILLTADTKSPGGEAEAVYDIVIENGTVIDPETGTHEVMNVGIEGAMISVLSKKGLEGKKTIDAKGKYVVPGFIDIQSYGPYYHMSLFKVADGVTTSLTLHGGSVDFKEWAEERVAEGPMVNYGSSVSHQFMRWAVGVGDRYAEASPEEIKKMVELARNALKDGALGISFSLEYSPGATYREIKPLFKVAAEFGAPCFLHLRYSDPLPPGTNEEAVDEAIRLARETGAVVHIHHITSTGGTFTMKETARQIEKAREEGIDITACIYPYNFWGTYLNSARFDKGWKKRFRIDYGDLQIAGKKERLTRKTFRKYRKEGKLAVAYAIPDEDVVTAVRAPWVMIGSDGDIKSTGNSHPRGAGCFSRVIRKYVREEETLSLDEAIRKMTLMPARLLEPAAPGMKSKGRVQAGMDADIVVFDYEKIRDTATVEEPGRYPEGIEYVLISGVIVRDHEKVYHKPTGRLITSGQAKNDVGGLYHQ